MVICNIMPNIMWKHYIRLCTYSRKASALLVLRIRAMRRPQTEERAISIDLALFLFNKQPNRGPTALLIRCIYIKSHSSLKQNALRNIKMADV